ncbi:hypothetical protein [Veronia pacifica]|uniref:Uncharacterized protein n=1 Tax=Veronia pacifica TaxID=1080227 RepID=A0A1C3E685_9GAMM|nr:hypothetical protein [Veronia pacifica]ODA28751.1 hypothetical protein A8L45_23055 [Veronia pacifica]
MQITKRHVRLFTVEQGLFPVLGNAFGNGIGAWVAFGAIGIVPMWGWVSMAGDIALTSFLLPFLTTLITSAIIKKQVSSGSVPRVPTNYLKHVEWLWCSPFLIGFFLGGLSFTVTGLPLILILTALQVDQMTVVSFSIFKAVWTGFLAMVYSPFIATWSLCRASQVA